MLLHNFLKNMCKFYNISPFHKCLEFRIYIAMKVLGILKKLETKKNEIDLNIEK